MDNGLALSPDEVKGRNMWMVWTGGNDLFWDRLSNDTFGQFDLLKTLSSHPELPAQRSSRFEYLGLINEPCFEKATGPDPERYGLWLDRRARGLPRRPVREREKYPGVKIGARGSNGAGRLLLRRGDRHSSGCGCFRTRISTSAPRKRGTPSDTTTIPTTTTTTIWCGPIASACRAASATSDRTR